MRTGLRLLTIIILVAMSGCAMSRGVDNDAADPLFPRVWGNDRVLLHNPGAIMLGPGLGKNAWRWLGDGEWGF